MYFVFAGILAFIFLASIGAVFIDKADGGDGLGGIATAIGSIVVLLVLTLAFSATTVSARAVGIQTSFGKYQATLSNGFHMTAPWSNVEEFSTQVQSLELTDNSAVKVTYKGGGGGAVNATVRWRINTDDAENLWKKYRTFDHVRDRLVLSSARDSFRVIVSNYTPNDARSGENIRPITETVKADLDKSLKADGVIIDSISIQNIELDANSQASLNKIVEANNNVERAKSEQQRAKIDAETARIRANAGVLSGPALVRYCLEVTNAWDTNKNGALPAGWNCFAPSTLIASK